MIVNLSLIVIGFCLLFITISKRIKMKWFAKFVMCQSMVGIVGILASRIGKHDTFSDLSYDLFFSSIAFLVCFATFYVYKRGGYK